MRMERGDVGVVVGASKERCSVQGIGTVRRELSANEEIMIEANLPSEDWSSESLPL